MQRSSRIGLGILGGLVAMVALLVLALALFNWNVLRPLVNDQVSTILGREFAIQGDLDLSWFAREGEPGSGGLSPHLSAERITLANPDGFASEPMAELERVDIWLSPWALFERRVAIARIALRGGEVRLERNAEGSDNWSFDFGESEAEAEEDSGSGWQVAIDEIVFDRLTVGLDDAVLDADLALTIEPLDEVVPFAEIAGAAETAETAPAAVPDYVFAWSIEGSYRGEPLTGSGQVGGALALRAQDRPFPVQLALRSGATEVELRGTITRPLDFGGAELDLSFAGASLDRLYGLTGITLPATPAYRTRGHLSVAFDTEAGSRFAYEDFEGEIGDSDIAGSLVYDRAGERPKLSGSLTSTQLRLADLAPLIGADSAEHKAERGEDSRQPADKLLPIEAFETATWSEMDADIEYRAERIEPGQSEGQNEGEPLALSRLYVDFVLEDGEILIDPLRFGLAGGLINTTLRLNGRQQPLAARIDLHARGLQLDQILPEVDALQSSLGQIDGDASLSARGNSVAALLGASSGRLTLLVERGAISENLMELAGLNVGNYLVGRLFGDELVEINCAAADISFDQGLATPNVFVFDTTNAVIEIEGETDFATERLDLTITPQSKGPRLFTLRSPLYVRGSFVEPSPGVAAGPLLARGAAAIALGVAATPAAALLALVDPTSGEANQCQPVIERIQAAEAESAPSGQGASDGADEGAGEEAGGSAAG